MHRHGQGYWRWITHESHNKCCLSRNISPPAANAARLNKRFQLRWKKKKKGRMGINKAWIMKIVCWRLFLFFFFFLNQQPLKLHNYRVWVYFVDECEFGLFKILEKPWLSVHPLTESLLLENWRRKKKKAQLELQEVFFLVSSCRKLDETKASAAFATATTDATKMCALQVWLIKTLAAITHS